MTMRLACVLVGTLAGVASTVTVGRALACETDADCGAGMICEEYEVGVPCEAPACEGEECKPVDCAVETTVESACTYAPCQVDADCGETLVCIERRSMACSGSAGCDGPDCEARIAPEETCVEEVEKACGPKYARECSVDLDCGEGFTCVEEEVCGCSSGGAVGSESDSGTAGASAGDIAEPMPAPECSCESTGRMACELNEIECTVDDDCPAGLLCNENPEGWCSSSPDGTEECGTEGPARVCLPEAWDAAHGVGLDGSGESTAQRDDANEDDAAASGDEDGADVEEAAAGASGQDEEDTENAGQKDEPEEDTESEDSASDAGSASDDDKGCSVASPAGGVTGLPWIALLGALGLVGRRRRR